MLNTHRKGAKAKTSSRTTLRRNASVAVLTLCFVATGTLSAFADRAYTYATNRLELAHPELARQYGSNPTYWPDRAFRNIDCNLPSNGCPTYMGTGQ
jgi:hypothetical protein